MSFTVNESLDKTAPYKFSVPQFIAGAGVDIGGVAQPDKRIHVAIKTITFLIYSLLFSPYLGHIYPNEKLPSRTRTSCTLHDIRPLLYV